MWIPIALIVSLLLSTAVIAHVSDTLGKRLGKKRVSVLGLRPRHSATVLTVASSWGIMGFTMLVLLGVYAPLKNAIFHYESERARLIQQTQEADDRLKISNANLELNRGQLKTLTANLQVSQQSIVGLQKQKRQAQQQTQTARAEEQRAQTKLTSARLGERNAKQAAKAAQKQQRDALATLRSAQEALFASQKNLKSTQTNLSKTQTQVAQASTALYDRQLKIKAAQARLKSAVAAKQRADLAASQAKQAAKQASQVAYRAGQQAIELQKEAEQLKIKNEQARAAAIYNFDAAVNQLADAQNLYQVAVRDIRLPVDQTIAERRLDAEQNPEQIEKELRYLVETSQAAAQKFLPDATVIARSTVPDPDKKGPITLNEAQTIQFFADQLAQINTPVSARLVSAFNYPAGETKVLARFVFVPIRTVYASRENITEGVIEANKSESAVFGQLQKLVDSARFNAVKRGASPPLSPDEQNFFDGDTGQKLFDALRQVQKVGHPTSVRIVAARDLDSAEPLQVRFVVGEEA